MVREGYRLTDCLFCLPARGIRKIIPEFDVAALEVQASGGRQGEALAAAASNSARDAFRRRLGSFGPAEYERLLTFVIEAAEAEDRRRHGRRRQRTEHALSMVPLRLLVHVLRLGAYDWYDFLSVAPHLASRMRGDCDASTEQDVADALQTAAECYRLRVAQDASEYAASDVIYRRWLRAVLGRSMRSEAAN